MITANVKFEFVALWIQIWGTPFDMFSLKVAVEIGSQMGEVVEEEETRCAKFFMRVKVALPTSKPIWQGTFLGGSNGKNMWVTFKY